MQCQGLHCEGCGHGGKSRAGGVAALIIVLVVVVCAAGAHKQIAQTADEVWRVVTIAAEVVAGLVGAAVAALVIYLCTRIGMYVHARSAARAAVRVRQAQPLPQPGHPALGADRPAIEPVHTITSMTTDPAMPGSPGVGGASAEQRFPGRRTKAG